MLKRKSVLKDTKKQNHNGIDFKELSNVSGSVSIKDLIIRSRIISINTPIKFKNVCKNNVL